MATLDERLKSGEVIILDGAMGTELERHGAPETGDAAWAEAIGTHPDLIRRVHEDYIRAGADVITTNTYSSGVDAMTKIGHAEEIGTWNTLAAELAQQARDNAAGGRAVYVAGSVAAFGNGAMRYVGNGGSIRWAEDDLDRLEANFRQQGQILADAGVDLILVELLQATSDDVEIAVRAASACGLPVWTALSCRVDSDSGRVLLDTRMDQDSSDTALLADVVDKLSGSGCSALLVMHSEIDEVEPALKVMDDHWDGPIGAYPNRTGYWDGKKWVFVEEVTPEAYANRARSWVEAGAQIVGGCCGFGPDHIAALRRELPNSV